MLDSGGGIGRAFSSDLVIREGIHGKNNEGIITASSSAFSRSVPHAVNSSQQQQWVEICNEKPMMRASSIFHRRNVGSYSI